MKPAKSTAVLTRPRTASEKIGATPRYVRRHRTLLENISGGKYSVDSVMPTEEQLSRRVSGL